MKIEQNVRACLEESVLCWLATVSKDGQPNVSPKEIFSLYDDEHIVIADIASPISVRNIKNNPNVCVCVIDIFSQSGFKLTGSAKVFAPADRDYAALEPVLSHIATSEYIIRNIILLKVEKVSKILAPSYHLHPERAEEQHRERTYKTYRVRPLE